MERQITAWSISRLLEYETCPHRTYLRHIAKAPLPEYEDTHPMIRGRRIHGEVEDYINGTTEDYPSSGKKLRPLLYHCRENFEAGLATVEAKWGFDADWDQCEWFDDNVWLRMATDCTITSNDVAEIYDWKTGKSFGNEVKYMQQMQLYACGQFMRNPGTNYIDVTLGFLDDGKTRVKNFERGPKINKLIARFTERGNRMIDTVDFRPKPNTMNCKYCPFGPTGTAACLYGVQ